MHSHRVQSRSVSLLTLVLVATVLTAACSTTQAAPDPAKSGDDMLTDILHRIRDEYHLPAVGAVVLRSDGIIAQAVVGVREAGGADPATGHDYFHIGSNT